MSKFVYIVNVLIPLLKKNIFLFVAKLLLNWLFAEILQDIIIHIYILSNLQILYFGSFKFAHPTVFVGQSEMYFGHSRKYGPDPFKLDKVRVN